MLALMLTGIEQSTAAEREKFCCLIIFLVFTNENKHQNGNYKMFQNMLFLV